MYKRQAQSLVRLQAVDLGTRRADVLTISLELPRDRYATPDRLAAFYREIVDRLMAAPGVASASVSGDVPLEGSGTEHLRVPGQSSEMLVRFKRLDASYFHTLGIPLVGGRGFTGDDRLGTPPVAIVNHALARRLRGPGASAAVIGSRVDLPLPGFAGKRAEMEVIGVVGDERVDGDLRAPFEPVAYVALAQHPRLQVKVSVHGPDVATLFPALRDTVHGIDPTLALADVRTLEQVWHASLAGVRGPAWLVGGFAFCALLVAVLGLYGILSHTVEQRQREIGIRLALGARPLVAAGPVLRGGAALLASGLALGYLGAAAAGQALSAILFEVPPTDPGSFALAGFAVLIAAGGVAVGPFRRAARVDPATTLRAEG